MKKISAKNKNRMINLNANSLKISVLKSLIANSNLFILTRMKAFQNLRLALHQKNSKVSLLLKCRTTLNKKRFNKRTFYSRHELLKDARRGLIHGLRKAIW